MDTTEADRAFQSWADRSDSLHLCGHPDLEAMKFTWSAAAAWSRRQALREAAEYLREYSQTWTTQGDIRYVLNIAADQLAAGLPPPDRKE